MRIWKQAKEATTLIVGMPLAFIAATVAAIALMLEWIGVTVVERFVPHR